jgi:hypothetical protein
MTPPPADQQVPAHSDIQILVDEELDRIVKNEE